MIACLNSGTPLLLGERLIHLHNVCPARGTSLSLHGIASICLAFLPWEWSEFYEASLVLVGFLTATCFLNASAGKGRPRWEGAALLRVAGVVLGCQGWRGENRL